MSLKVPYCNFYSSHLSYDGSPRSFEVQIWGHMDLDFLGQSFFQLLKRTGLSSHIKHCLDFSFVFSAPLPAWRNLFSASVFFCCGSFQPGCTGIFWPAEGTSQPLTISKKWKNPSSTLSRKRIWVQALPRFSTCSRAYWRRAQISNPGRACTQDLLLHRICGSYPNRSGTALEVLLWSS